MSILDPRIKLTLGNGVDLIFKVVENRHSKEGLTCGAHKLGDLQVGPAGPACQHHKLGCGGLASRVFWSLPKSVSSRINMIYFIE